MKSSLIPLVQTLMVVGCMLLSFVVACAPKTSVQEDGVLFKGAPEGVDPQVWQQVQVDLSGDDLTGKDGTFAKVGQELTLLFREYQAHLVSNATENFRASNPLLRVSEGLVLIDATASNNATTLLEELEALGLEGGAGFGRVVSGRLPILAIEEAAALDSLQFARPAMMATR